MGLDFLLKRNKGEKATLGTSFWSHISIGSAARILLRLFQFVMGLVVIGLYAQDLNNARKAGVYMDSKWVWAVVCGTLGCLASLTFMLPLVKAWFFFYVDAFVFLCYLVAFGIFGKMYIPEDAEGNKGIIRMKHAVWVLLTNMLLWLMTAGYGAVVFWKTRKARTTLTGRGAQHV
ncbi:hypothetical protein CC86DRAFT_101364 [Ophiobolus disseminans]|uniref:MARVEL domain-containing protein n=1 Tax=Ophiobolus disseminans TaxID=1469910 RepID=A0A6A6ZN97_9PLEO|nr:hypothetical protein CC86DRAFT_101364 [Ophiobolus disseminans]